MDGTDDVEYEKKIKQKKTQKMCRTQPIDIGECENHMEKVCHNSVPMHHSIRATRHAYELLALQFCVSIIRFVSTLFCFIYNFICI